MVSNILSVVGLTFDSMPSILLSLVDLIYSEFVSDFCELFEKISLYINARRLT